MLRLEVRPSAPLRAGCLVLSCPIVASLRSFRGADSSPPKAKAPAAKSPGRSTISADYLLNKYIAIANRLQAKTSASQSLGAGPPGAAIRLTWAELCAMIALPTTPKLQGSVDCGGLN